MLKERTVHRYTAFFPGWATAFGAHDKEADEPRGLIWLYGDNQLGLILTPEIKHFLFPLLLGDGHEGSPEIEIGSSLLRIQGSALAIGEGDQRPYTTLINLIRDEGELYLTQTYHLVYPTGTRILTLGRKTPLPLVYREIAPMVVKLI